jgi:hypothetical protein
MSVHMERLGPGYRLWTEQKIYTVTYEASVILIHVDSSANENSSLISFNT